MNLYEIKYCFQWMKCDCSGYVIPKNSCKLLADSVQESIEKFYDYISKGDDMKNKNLDNLDIYSVELLQKNVLFDYIYTKDNTVAIIKATSELEALEVVVNRFGCGCGENIKKVEFEKYDIYNNQKDICVIK